MTNQHKTIKQLLICFTIESLLICSILLRNDTDIISYENTVYDGIVEPETVEPETVEPDTVELDTVEPETVELDTVELDTVEPETVELDTVEPDTVEPDTVEPDTVEPDTVEPDTVEPDTVEPETTEPDIVEPETVEPETVEPETTEPDIVEPETVEPETAETVIISSGIVETIGNVSNKWVTKADAMLSKLPQNALDCFHDSGYHFYVTDEDIGKTEFGGTIGRCAGVTKYGQYIKIEDRQFAVDEATLHEFGHFVFHECNNWNKIDVINAFNSDVINASLMNITYGLDDVSEFYAEVFQKYIKNPEQTSQVFPNLTAIIQSDLDSL